MMSPPTGLGLDGTTSVLRERRPEDPEKEGPSKKPVCFQDKLPETKSNPADELDLHPAMTTEMINIFRQKGTDYQSWINSPEDTNCQRPCIVSPRMGRCTRRNRRSWSTQSAHWTALSQAIYSQTRSRERWFPGLEQIPRTCGTHCYLR